jgi:hypothetical protein
MEPATVTTTTVSYVLQPPYEAPRPVLNDQVQSTVKDECLPSSFDKTDDLPCADMDNELKQVPQVSRSGYKFTHGSFVHNNPSSLSPQMSCDNPEKKNGEIPKHNPDTMCKACGNALGVDPVEFGCGQFVMSCVNCGACYHICKSGNIKYGLSVARECPDCLKYDDDSQGGNPHSDHLDKEKEPKVDEEPKSSRSDKVNEEKKKICPICGKQLSKPILWELLADGTFGRKNPVDSVENCCIYCSLVMTNEKIYLVV